MAHLYDEPSRTFGEFLLIPNLTRKGTIPARVDLKTPIVRYTKGSSPPLSINVPITAAMMQAVCDDKMAIALARCGGLAFIFGSQSIASQAEMVRRVKNHKAGFVVSDSNVRPSQRWPTCWQRPKPPATRRSPSPKTARPPAAWSAS